MTTIKYDGAQELKILISGVSGLFLTIRLLLHFSLGALIDHFHIGRDWATWVVASLVGGGGWIITVYFPYIAPFVATLRGLIAVFGTGFAVGW